MAKRGLETAVIPHEKALSQLREIRSRGGIGSPLYTYRVTAEEVSRLAQFVKKALCLRCVGSHEASAYCLVASHVLCQSYSGGSWKWEPVDELMGEPPSRERIIGRGLQAWGREVVRCGSHRQWLYTLASEGGLPLGMLAAGGSQFESFFRRLLVQAETFPSASLQVLVEDALRTLPQSLQNDAVLSLAVDLVARIREFRAACGEGPAKMDTLEEKRPNWRDDLPVDVHDDVARRLIDGLLSLKVERGKAGASRALRVSTRLVEGELGQFSLRHTLQVPIRASQDDLLRQLGVKKAEETDAPPRFNVSLVRRDGTLEPLFHAGQGTKPGTYALEPFGASRKIVLTLDAQSALLQAHHQGSQLGPPVRVSEELGPMPWIFSGDEFELLSVGPCATTRKDVLIAFERGKRIELTGDSGSAGAEIDRVGELPDDTRELWLLREGEATVEHDGERYSVRTAAEIEQAESIRLHGDSIAFSSGSAWLGCPEVYREEGPVEVPVSRNDVQWRGKGDSGEWFRYGDQCRGDVQLRVRVRGVVVHRASATILPPQFKVRPSPGKRPGEGTIELTGLEGAEVGVRPQDGFSFGVQLSMQGARVEVAADEGVEVRDIPLVIRWGKRETEVRVTYPGSFVGFIGPGGIPLKGGRVVAVDRLFGVRARALTSNTREEFFLVARVEGEEYILARLGTDGATLQEMALDHVQDRIEALLSRGLDAEVELFVAPMGGSVGQFRRQAVRVHWYDANLKPNKRNANKEPVEPGGPATNCWLVSCPEAATLGGALRCEAHRLDDPQRERVVTLPLHEDGWWFDGTQYTTGAWLVSAWKGGALVARPLMVSIRDLDAEPSAEERLEAFKARALNDDGAGLGLADAIAVVNMDERRRALARVVRRLAADAAHPDWPAALAYVDSMKDFPADTYELVRNIAYNSDALALAMLKLAGSRFPTAWDKFEDFQFIWPTFPIESWANALRVYCETQLGELGEDLLRLVLDNLRNDLAPNKVLSECWTVILEYMGRRIPIFPKPNQSFINVSSFLEPQVREQIQKMGVRHADEEWPKFEWKELLPGKSLDWGRVFKLVPTAGQSYRAPVLAAPAVAAAISVGEVVPSPKALLELRYARSFDEPYFDFTYSYALARLLQEKFEQ